MIKLLTARYLGNFQVELTFSDGKVGFFSGLDLLIKWARLGLSLVNIKHFPHNH